MKTKVYVLSCYEIEEKYEDFVTKYVKFASKLQKQEIYAYWTRTAVKDCPGYMCLVDMSEGAPEKIVQKKITDVWGVRPVICVKTNK